MALEGVFAPCWERNVPVCLSVIPASAFHFGPEGPIRKEIVALQENDLLRDLVRDRVAAGLSEIALHGWQHHHGELANGSVAGIRRKLESGLDVLHTVWPDCSIRVLVPPHDYLSGAGLNAAHLLDLGVCSAWASLHGGTSLVHFVGRVRQKMGLSFGSSARNHWHTDITVTDFVGDEERDWPATQRILSQARRRKATIVFVLHYWRLLDAQGSPGKKYSRWRRWLDQISTQPDIQFSRFCDDS